MICEFFPPLQLSYLHSFFFSFFLPSQFINSSIRSFIHVILFILTDGFLLYFCLLLHIASESPRAIPNTTNYAETIESATNPHTCSPNASINQKKRNCMYQYKIKHILASTIIFHYQPFPAVHKTNHFCIQFIFPVQHVSKTRLISYFPLQKSIQQSLGTFSIHPQANLFDGLLCSACENKANVFSN